MCGLSSSTLARRVRALFVSFSLQVHSTDNSHTQFFRTLLSCSPTAFEMFRAPVQSESHCWVIGHCCIGLLIKTHTSLQCCLTTDPWNTDEWPTIWRVVSSWTSPHVPTMFSVHEHSLVDADVRPHKQTWLLRNHLLVRMISHLHLCENPRPAVLIHSPDVHTGAKDEPFLSSNLANPELTVHFGHIVLPVATEHPVIRATFLRLWGGQYTFIDINLSRTHRPLLLQVFHLDIAARFLDGLLLLSVAGLLDLHWYWRKKHHLF